MSYQQPPQAEPTVRVSAGTAVKIGFFGAIGAFLFSLILSIVGFVGVVILTALGVGVFDRLG